MWKSIVGNSLINTRDQRMLQTLHRYSVTYVLCFFKYLYKNYCFFNYDVDAMQIRRSETHNIYNSYCDEF